MRRKTFTFQLLLSFLLVFSMGCQFLSSALLAETPTATLEPFTATSTTATSAPTATATATPVPLPDISWALPKLSDLPDGYFQVPASSLTFTGREMIGERHVVERVFLFLSTDYRHKIFGIVTLLSPADTTRFDELIDEPDYTFQYTGKFLGIESIQSFQKFDHLEDLGDTHAGLKIYTTLKKSSIMGYSEMIMFRRGNIGVYVISSYPPSEPGHGFLASVVHNMDKNISQRIASQPIVLPEHLPPLSSPSSSATNWKDISWAGLRIENFPKGYEEFTPEELGLSKDKTSGNPDNTEHYYTFANSSEKQIIFGYARIIASASDLGQFDLLISDPDAALQKFLDGFGGKNVRGWKAIPGIANIGDIQSGRTVIADANGKSYRFDMIIFRDYDIGVITLGIYPIGTEPSRIQTVHQTVLLSILLKAVKPFRLPFESPDVGPST